MSQQAATAAQPLDVSGGVDLNIPVRAINRSDEPITWKYARVKHVLQPGVPTFIPYLAMVLYQGDPRAINIPGGRITEQYRRNELERLSILHGVYENSERWATIPLIECYPIDSDVPFNTVIRDPEGTNATPGNTGQPNQTAFLEQQLAKMADQMRVMQAQILVQNAATGAVEAAGIDPADLDKQDTMSKAVAPEEAGLAGMGGPHPERQDPASGSAVTKKKLAPGEGPAVTRDA
jgi:hypothetical protein